MLSVGSERPDRREPPESILNDLNVHSKESTTKREHEEVDFSQFWSRTIFKEEFRRARVTDRLLADQDSEQTNPDALSSSPPNFPAQQSSPPPLDASCNCTGNNAGADPDFGTLYGTYCAPWDITMEYCVPGGQLEDEEWCDDHWCYVPSECSGAVSALFFEQQNLWWSVTPCKQPTAPPAQCGAEVLDSDTACTTEHLIAGAWAVEGVNDTPEFCCVFCREKFPESTHSEFWTSPSSPGWCGCHSSCATTRCISEACTGMATVTVVTLHYVPSLPPFPTPPLPPPWIPPYPPGPPQLPPAPPLVLAGDSGQANITVTSTAYAAQHLARALDAENVTRILLFVNASLSSEALLPPVSRAVEVLGRCTVGDGLCEVSGGGEHAIFSVSTGGELRLEMLALRFGFTISTGAAIFLEASSSAALHGCVFAANHAGVFGGAAFVGQNSTLSVTGGRIEENSSNGNGGGVFLAASSNLTLSDTSLMGNSVLQSGGGVFAANGATVMMRGAGAVWIALNRAGESGGGICGVDAMLQLRGEWNILNNTAGTDGGGISCQDGCTVKLADGAIVAGNAAAVHGGGMHLSDNSSVALESSGVVRHNAAGATQRDGCGGGVFATRSSEVVVRDAYVSGNTAKGHGGGIYLSNSSSATINGWAAVEMNSVEGEGGGMYGIGGGLILVEQGGIFNNVAISRGIASYGANTMVALRSNSSVSGNRAGGDAGGIYSYAAQVEVRHSIVAHNVAEGKGGGVCSDGGVTAVLDSSQLYNNTAGHSGGGLFVTHDGYLLVANHSAVWQNSAQSSGGGIHAESGSLVEVLSHSWILGNAALQGKGGAASVLEGQLTMRDNCTVKDNKASSHGGALYHYGGSLVTLSHVSIMGNAANGSGGAVYLYAGCIGRLEQANVTNNSALVNAGGIPPLCWTTVLPLHPMQRMVMLGGSACTPAPASLCSMAAACSPTGPSGGIGAELHCVVELYGGSMVAGNSAEAVGGGVHLLDQGALHAEEGCSIQSNHAKFLGGNLMAGSSRVELNGTLLTRGLSEGLGGGAYLEKSAVTLRGVVVSDCLGNAGGGGVMVDSATMATFEGVLFLGCSASAGGGGGISSGENAALTMTGCVLRENVALTRGGGVWVESDSTVACKDSVFIQNAASDGAGIAVGETRANLTLWNSTFEGGQAAGQGGGIYLKTASNSSIIPELRTLQFNRSVSFVGPNVYWDIASPFAASRAVTCDNCTSSPPGGYLISTSAQHFQVAQWGDAVNSVHGVSGQVLYSPLVYMAIDYYGQVTNLPYSTSISVYSGGARLAGQTYTHYKAAHGAMFENLVIYGQPGNTFQLQFHPQSQNWEPVTLAVTLAQCQKGEAYDRDAELCHPCSPGYLKFSNSTEECTLCVEGLACPGRNVYEVKSGFWLAPNAQHCGNDMACFMARVYACAQEAACTSSEAGVSGRGGNSSAAAGTLHLCMSEKYEEGVLCGGTIPPVCSKKYFRSRDMESCTRCPSKSALLSGVACVVFLPPIVLVLLFRYGDFDYLFEVGTTDRIGWDAVKASVAALMGYMQVMSQMGLIYDAEIFPPAVHQFLSYLNVMNLDLSLILNFKCLRNEFDLGMEEGGTFWESLYNAMVLPWLLPLAILVGRLGPGKWLTQRAKDKIISVSLFLLFLFHPWVATTVFQFFRCEEYHYLSDSGGATQFLWADTSVQCMTLTWYSVSGAAYFTIVVFIVGFPVTLLWVMMDLRGWRKMRMVPEETYALMVQAGDCIPAPVERGVTTWTPRSSSFLQYLAISVSDPTAAPGANGPGEDEEENADGIEVYVKKSSYIECWDEPPQINEIKPEEQTRRTAGDGWGCTLGFVDTQWHTAMGKQLQLHGVRHAHANNLPITELHKELGIPDKSRTLRRAWLVLRDGTSVAVFLHETKSVEDKGRVMIVPVTCLHSMKSVLGQFYESFEDRFYWFQCWEMCRRFLQTGLVVPVQLMCGQPFAVLYGAVFAFLAIAFQLRCTPYTDDNLDTLYLVILTNQFFMQMFMLYFLNNYNYQDMVIVTVCFFAIQLSILFYVAKIVGPTILDIWQAARMRANREAGKKAPFNSRDNPLADLDRDVESDGPKEGTGAGCQEKNAFLCEQTHPTKSPQHEAAERSLELLIRTAQAALRAQRLARRQGAALPMCIGGDKVEELTPQQHNTHMPLHATRAVTAAASVCFPAYERASIVAPDLATSQTSTPHQSVQAQELFNTAASSSTLRPLSAFEFGAAAAPAKARVPQPPPEAGARILFLEAVSGTTSTSAASTGEKRSGQPAASTQPSPPRISKKGKSAERTEHDDVDIADLDSEDPWDQAGGLDAGGFIDGEDGAYDSQGYARDIQHELTGLTDAVGCSFTAVSQVHEDAVREPSALTLSAQTAMAAVREPTSPTRPRAVEYEAGPLLSEEFGCGALYLRSFSQVLIEPYNAGGPAGLAVASCLPAVGCGKPAYGFGGSRFFSAAASAYGGAQGGDAQLLQSGGVDIPTDVIP
ncbi:hypothetical protein CYMTET_40788 [Cymbomonas tetramitiformis]|uniref:Uncharacterized protein n=1 Tax=Cymbomonas tetramitiformis TaxID=36881 RepID=A0AAE0F3A4_9CHLO|nr:hypothetical protein CYMTET_40788 [Cymbomonas tetramitiformis]